MGIMFPPQRIVAKKNKLIWKDEEEEEEAKHGNGNTASTLEES